MTALVLDWLRRLAVKKVSEGKCGPQAACLLFTTVRGWFVYLTCAIAFATVSGRAAADEVAQAELDAAIERAADFLVRQVQDNGQFRYRSNTNPAVIVPPKYNMLRHAGTMYALGQFYRQHPQPPIKRVLTEAGQFLRSQIAELPEVPHVLAVWSDPAIHHGRDSRRAKLGGTGLGLVALCQWESLLPGSVPKSQLERLGDFLLFMQKDDGAFYSFYLLENPGRDDTWTSLYYPGEAALGLLMLDQLHPDPEWLRGAYEALHYLAVSRRQATHAPPDHWSLIATQKLLAAIKNSDEPEMDRPLLISHATQIVRGMLREQQTPQRHLRFAGCFSNDGRTTPTATRLEGLLAALDYLPATQAKMRGEIAAACHRGMRFLLQAQLQEGPFRGGFPRAVGLLPENHPAGSPQFNERATEIRIDYVQHALSAMLGYRAVFHAE